MQRYLTYLCTDINETGPSLVIFMRVDQFYVLRFLFCRVYFELIENYYVSLKKLLQQGIYDLEFYGNLVYKFQKILENPNFSDLFKRIVNRFKNVWYNLDIMRQTACLFCNPIISEGYATILSCTAMVQA